MSSDEKVRNKSARLSDDDEKMRDKSARLSNDDKKVRDKSARLSNDNEKVRDKSARLSDDDKMPQKTLDQYNLILNSMEKDQWYSAKDFIDIVNVKERRIRILLNELVKKNYVITNGKTKGKRYKKL